jgi:hypothetical protein
MADATTEQAIAISTGIVGALHAAGVLQTQAALSTLAPPAGSEAIAISSGIVSALSAAGVLRGQGTPATPPPPATPGPEVGDVVVTNIRQIAKLVWTEPPALKYRLTREGSNTTYELEFPPNDEVYKAEFERLMTINRPSLIITANMRITEKLSHDIYGVELGRLTVFAGFG